MNTTTYSQSSPRPAWRARVAGLLVLLGYGTGASWAQEAPPCGPAAPMCQGQTTNILSNGSFEAGICSPTNANARDFGNQLGSGAVWGRTGCWLGYASPDRFTSQSGCASSDNGVFNSVPFNVFNSVTSKNTATPRWPHGGSLYAGIYAKGPAQAGSQVDEREYVMQQLPQALTPGRPYYAEYYASLAQASYFTLKKLQIAFSNTMPVSPSLQGAGPILTGVSVVVSSGALTNSYTPGWDRVGGSFMPPAGSSYSTMILGNFDKLDVDTSPSGYGPGNPLNASPYPASRQLDGAYYYIDDVLLVPFPSAGPATQQVACGGQVQLGSCGLPAGAGATYSWSPTTGLSNPFSPNPVLTASSTPGQAPVTYTLTVTAGGFSYPSSTTVYANCGPVCGPDDLTCNIVSNSSFEAGDCSPSTPDAHDFGYLLGGAAVWGRTGCWLGYASPDRFTSQSGCASSDNGVFNSVPYNVFNSVTGTNTAAPRWPRSGNQYGGIYAKDPTHAGSQVDEREYVMQQLAQPLTPGRPCYAEYYASLAQASYFTLKKLQIAFSSTMPVSYNGAGAGPVLTTPTVVVSSGALTNSSTPGWDRVGGSFMSPAGSSYRTMILGNFAAGDVDITPSGYGPGNPLNASPYPASRQVDGAYYYIDDVLLMPFPAAGPAFQQVACGSQVRLGGCRLPAAAGATYSWSPTTGLSNPNSANPTLTTPFTDTQLTYTLTVTAGGFSYPSTTTVKVSCLAEPPIKEGRQVGEANQVVQLEAYPNPTRDQLSIKVSGLLVATARFQLVEISTGRVVRTLDAVHDGSSQLKVSGLPAGVYAGRLVGESEQVLSTCKVVVIH